LCDDYLCPRLGEVDAAHRAAGVAWLLAKPVGTQLWLGPVFQPGQPGCWHCLTVRLWRHRCAENSAQRELGRSGPAPRPVAAVPPAAAAAANLIALEAAKWLAGHRHPGQRAVWTFDTFTFAGRHHEFRPYPQCATCGNPALVREQAHRPVILRSRRTASRGDGHRALAPDLVQARYRHLVSPVTGVIKEIRRDRRGPAQFNCFRSGTNPAAPVPDLDRLRAMLRQENGGKGVTTLHAEVSALCEAVERYSGTFHGDEERVRGSMRSLGEVCMHPNDFMLFDRRQYERRADWNARHGDFQQVCDPFDPEAVLDWSPVWSLTEQRHRLLPTGYLYYGVPAEPDRWYVRADSNGNAAGSSLEDAVLQGLLELVERDSVALWWYNRTRAAGVDLDAFADPWIDELRDVYDEVDRRVWVLDLTADLEIPVMAAVSSRRSGPDEIIFGFGAHLDPRTALRRALAELNQLMPALLAGRDGQQLDLDDPDAAAWWREASLANQPYLVPDPRVRPRRPSDYAYTPNRDLLRDVAVVRERVEASGLPVLVLDQTRPDVGLPVVKVLAPGLRPFWARFAPGRLFDVPVRLGRRARPARFEDLNPYPIFL
ncbi:MAG TPA: TOMM precursor leader peptide-binding protein, partial [Actinophytocola sp.]|uniref:TOMM precursor leader peptide-binding protein n=1 Tax=Actinophytocola sp. TaxID=1872138 RepID=UPI002DDCF599